MPSGVRACAHLLLQGRGLELSRGPVVEDNGLDAPVLLQVVLHGSAHAQVAVAKAPPKALNNLRQLHLHVQGNLTSQRHPTSRMKEISQRHTEPRMPAIDCSTVSACQRGCRMPSAWACVSAPLQAARWRGEHGAPGGAA